MAMRLALEPPWVVNRDDELFDTAVSLAGGRRASRLLR